MNFSEFKGVIKDTPCSDSLEFQPAIFWVPREYLPLGVTSIGDDVSGVIKIPAYAVNKSGKKVPVIAISRDAFAGHERITDIILPSSIDNIPAGAFSGCSGLKRITFPRNITSIGEETFAGCSSLEDVYYEGTMNEWKKINIVHQKHEIEFGDLVLGTPVQEIKAERLIHIPGNDDLLTANVHFHCVLSDRASCYEAREVDAIRMKGKRQTIWRLFRTV